MIIKAFALVALLSNQPFILTHTSFYLTDNKPKCLDRICGGGFDDWSVLYDMHSGYLFQINSTTSIEWRSVCIGV